jgi:NAD-dependent deacetylase
MKNIVVISGAGISAESGLKTFRDSNGLWEGHDVMEVATPLGFKKNPELVLEFYNQRRRQLLEVHPNLAHKTIADLEKIYKVSIITQNVDDLHERAGSSFVLHLHGELFKVRSTKNENNIQSWRKDLFLGDLCKDGFQLRPHIVWFGEDVPLMLKAISVCEKADVLIIVGTSMQVYPAASLINYVPLNTKVYYIDPTPAEINYSNLIVIEERATTGILKVKNDLVKKINLDPLKS